MTTLNRLDRENYVGFEIRARANSGLFTVHDLADHYGYNVDSIYRILRCDTGEWSQFDSFGKINIRKRIDSINCSIAHTLRALNLKLAEIGSYLRLDKSSICRMLKEENERFVRIPISLNKSIVLDGRRMETGKYYLEHAGGRFFRLFTPSFKVSKLVDNATLKGKYSLLADAPIFPEIYYSNMRQSLTKQGINIDSKTTPELTAEEIDKMLGLPA